MIIILQLVFNLILLINILKKKKTWQKKWVSLLTKSLILDHLVFHRIKIMLNIAIYIIYTWVGTENKQSKGIKKNANNNQIKKSFIVIKKIDLSCTFKK